MSNAEVTAILSVLWHTSAIRAHYEDRALSTGERMWRNNGRLFTNFARYNFQKWKNMMGSDDPTVRGRRISQAAMAQARQDFEAYYREPVRFALELVDKIRGSVEEAVAKHGPTKHGECEEEVGAEAWTVLAANPEVRKRLVEFARDWSEATIASIKP